MMAKLTPVIEQRWLSQFQALANGEDVAPGQRLRLEGLMEAAVLVGEIESQQLEQAMLAVYEDCFGRSVAQDYGEDWKTLFPFPQIPAMAKRAPVIPTTKD